VRRVRAIRGSYRILMRKERQLGCGLVVGANPG
jgi:hypothetical protein